MQISYHIPVINSGMSVSRDTLLSSRYRRRSSSNIRRPVNCLILYCTVFGSLMTLLLLLVAALVADPCFFCCCCCHYIHMPSRWYIRSGIGYPPDTQPLIMSLGKCPANINFY